MSHYGSTTAEVPSGNFTEDSLIWDSLKDAISQSSGFQRWRLEHQLASKPLDMSLENQVSRYLRETLETLAY